MPVRGGLRCLLRAEAGLARPPATGRRSFGAAATGWKLARTGTVRLC